MEGVKINVAKFNGCDDPFFYQDMGTIAETEDYCFRAVGEIRVHKENKGLVYDGKERGSGFGFIVKNDDDLAKVKPENGLHWKMNNWFEIFEKKDNKIISKSIVGYSYNRALEEIKELQRNKEQKVGDQQVNQQSI